MVLKRRGYQEPLEYQVLRFIRENQLLSNQSQLLVAVSGGPDSVCLLHILVRLKEELNIKLHIAHLNHQLRGGDSEEDAWYVSKLANQLGIPATIETRNVKAYQARQHDSLEAAAREVRYAFLAEVADSIGTDHLAVGHTVDDHIETVLMHLIRGTGTRGLVGLQPGTMRRFKDRELTVVRPLLQVTRQETSEYCDSYQLAPRIDATNLSLSPLRNRIRHQLLPLLRSYNSRVDDAILRTARIAGDDIDFLDKESARLWGNITQRQEGAIVLHKDKFLELPHALQRHLLRMAIEILSGNLKDIEARHIEGIIAALTKQAGKRLNLPGGLLFIIEYDRYLLSLKKEALSPFPPIENEFILKIPGETLLNGWRVKATIINQKQMKDKDSDFTAYLNPDAIGEKVMVRNRQAGDRFQPLGMSQTKKLGEYMIDSKIPRAWRQRVPIVCSPEHILWVVGWRIDDRAKVTKNTANVLRLEFMRISDKAT